MSNFNLAILREKYLIWMLLSAILGSFSGCSCSHVTQPVLREKPVTPLLQLPAAKTTGTVALEEAIARRRSLRQFASDSLSLSEVSQLLWSAQGVTEPAKGFRAAPSAGALYPLELFLLASNVASLTPGIYLYHPHPHALQLIVAGDQIPQLSQAAWPQKFVANAPAVIAIVGVISITAGRYGARAEKYVYLEAGHAGQNIYLQATALGLSTVAVGAFHPDMAAESLNLLDSETPLYLFPVGKTRTHTQSP